jgi:putative DNA methylase
MLLPRVPIEITFPTTKVNLIAEKESTGFGRRHYRPWSMMHKWWARRLGSVFRTILLYTLADHNLDGWDQNPESLWSLYPHELDLNGKIVLDPMMGGGTTVIEALRLGNNVIGWDLNPVAWFVVKKQVDDIDPQILLDTLEQLEHDLGSELRKYYITSCNQCGTDAEAIYYFYFKEIDCPSCGKGIPLLRDYFLAKSPVNENSLVVCPKCWSISETGNLESYIECKKCRTPFLAKGSSSGTRQEYHCVDHACESGKIVDWIREKGRPREHMYAVEFYCKSCDESKNPNLKRGRGYKAADSADFDLLQSAQLEFDEIRETLPIPDTPIPDGVETRRALNHGYVQFSDMFCKRQLLNLGKIAKWIDGIEDWNLREFFALAFSNCLKYNNMFAKYNSTRAFITDIFRTHSFSPSMAPVEANCYDTTKGRGPFTAFVKLVKEGKQYCRNPFERVILGEKQSKIEHSKPIVGLLVNEFGQLGKQGNVLLGCGSSEKLDIPDAVVDAVITDPPYADNLMYSELSNFFYVWLRILLKDKYECFAGDLVPWEEEVIANRVQGKGEKEFHEGLTRIFSEANRVLTDDGLLVFTFHHRKPEAWGSMVSAILDAGFFVNNVYPIRSEMKASTHLHKMSNITIDMIFVCKKRESFPPETEWSILKQKMVDYGREAMRFYQGSTSPRNLDDFIVYLGKCLEIYSQYYPNVMDDGNKITVNHVINHAVQLFDNLYD